MSVRTGPKDLTAKHRPPKTLAFIVRTPKRTPDSADWGVGPTPLSAESGVPFGVLTIKAIVLGGLCLGFLFWGNSHMGIPRKDCGGCILANSNKIP